MHHTHKNVEMALDQGRIVIMSSSDPSTRPNKCKCVLINPDMGQDIAMVVASKIVKWKFG